MLKFLSTRFLRPLMRRYLSKERGYSYKNIKLKIFPGVFHPAFFFSTKFLLHSLEQFDLKGKKILELGAGSGLISFVAENKGGEVTASDLSGAAIKGLQFNKEKLQSAITIIKSDLFDEIPKQQFDFILINPPYFPENPTNEAQLAWYCGEHFEYFNKFFSQLSPFVNSACKVIMVLSEECHIPAIEQIAAENGFLLEECERKKIWWELNFIFEIRNKHTSELS